MVDYNIEFAHIYVDQNPSNEQTRSIEILNDTIKELEEKNKSFCTVVLIDDFTPERTILDIDAYIAQAKKDTIVDFLAFESQLSMFSYKFIRELPAESIKIKKIGNVETKRFMKSATPIDLITKTNKPSCSLLIAIWYLCRLGVYGIPAKTRKYGAKPFEGGRSITILDKKYRETESKVLELIKATKYAYLLEKIEYKYF